MRPRYLVLVGRDADLVQRARRIADATGLRLANATPIVAVLANPACSVLDIDKGAAVIGTLFHRHGPARAATAFTAACTGRGTTAS